MDHFPGQSVFELRVAEMFCLWRPEKDIGGNGGSSYLVRFLREKYDITCPVKTPSSSFSLQKKTGGGFHSSFWTGEGDFLEMDFS